MVLNYQLVFILNGLVCILMMKALSWVFTTPAKRPPFLSFEFGWPYFSTQTNKARVPPQNFSPWVRFLFFSILLAGLLVSAKKFLSPLGYVDRMIIGVSVYFFLELGASFAQILYSWRKERILPIHDSPFISASLSDFWGHRWNVWIQDWIADMGRPFRRNEKQKIFASFFFSGAFHEYLVNFPHWLLTGESYFGTMIAYFAIQAAGLYGDKKFFRHTTSISRKIYCWLVVILPSPLFINVPVLRFFGMTE